MQQIDNDNSASDIKSQADNEKLSAASGGAEDKLSDTPGSFKELSNLISDNTNGTVDLYKNYTRTNTSDASYVLINKELTIDGHGNTVDAKKLKSSRIFHISTSSKVVIKNLTITGATNNAVYVYSSDANFEFINCTFKNNVYQTYPAYGAAICCVNTVSSFKFTNVTFDTNTVTCSGDYAQYYGYGGAIYFKTTANGSFDNVTFTNNKVMATDKTRGCGGAIFFGAAANNIDFIKCNFIGNTARTNGGAIFYYSTSSNNRFINTTFRDNKVTTVKTTANYGGAICFNGTITNNNFTNVNFTNNQAPFGGAIYLKLASGLEFNDVNFTKNNAGTYPNTNTNTGDGGAIYISSNTIYGKFNHVTFDENSAKANGGAIYFNSIVTSNNFTNVSFIKNDAQLGKGGAIYFNYGVTGVEFNTVNFKSNNASSYGGAISISPRTGGSPGAFSKNKFINTNFTDNFAKYCGGAISNSAGFNKNEFSDVNFVENSVSYNTNSIFGGGAFYSSYLVTDNLFTRVNFTNNSAGKGITAPQMSGGAMLIGSISRNNTFNQTNFINNYAKSGGAIKYSSTSTGDSFIDTVFEDNVAEDNGYSNQGYGGAIYYTSSVTSQNLENVKFIHNHADNYGGAICTFVPLNISGSHFTNCSAKEGGAIYANCSNLTVSDSTFTNNTAHSGGAIQYFGNSLKVSDTTMLENKVNSTDILFSLDKTILTVALKGNENYLNAIYSNCTPEFKNVTYWNGNNVNTDNHDDNTSYNETKQDITLEIYKDGQLKDTAYLVTSTSGKATYDFSTLGAGTYTYKAHHPDSTYYAPIDKTGTITVHSTSVDVNLTVNVENNEYGQNTTIKVTLKDINGNNLTGVKVNVTVNGSSYNITITDGYGERNITLPAGDNYLANATFKGNSEYNAGNATDYFNVTKIPSSLEILNNITFVYGGSNSTTVDYDGATNVTAHVIGHTEATVTVGNKIITVSGLPAGNYTLNVTTDADGNHTPVSKQANITVYNANASVYAGDVSEVYGINATLTIESRNATSVRVVVFNETDIVYTNESTLANGNVVLPVLNAGNYKVNLTTTPLNGNYSVAFYQANLVIIQLNSSVFIDPILNVTYNAASVINFTVENATAVSWIIKNRQTGVEINDGGLDNITRRLDAGNYTITIVNGDAPNIKGSRASANFTVKKANAYVHADDVSEVYGINATLTIESRNATSVRVVVFNETDIVYTNESALANGNVVLPVLNAGNYKVNLTTTPLNGNYSVAFYQANLVIIQLNSSVFIDPIVNVTYYDATVINFTVENATNVSWIIRGINIDYAAVDTGLNNISRKLDAGNYTITITNRDTPNIKGSNATAYFTVYKIKPTVEVIVKNVTVGTPFYINCRVGGGSASDYVLSYANGTVKRAGPVSDLLYKFEDVEVGDYIATIFTVEDGNHIKSNGTAYFSVLKPKSLINIVKVTNVTYNDRVDVVFEVENATTVTYVVKSQDGTTAVQNTTATATSFKLPVLAPGKYVITIANAENGTYAGDVKSAGFTVKKASSAVTVAAGNVTYPDNVTVSLSVVNPTTVKYNLTKDGVIIVKNAVWDYKNIVLSNLASGNYVITVSNAENAYYLGDVKSAEFTVKKAPSTLNASDITFVEGKSGNTTVTYSGATGVNASVVNHTEATVKVENNLITVSGLKAGNYTLNITTLADENHTAVSKEVNVFVASKPDFDMNVTSTSPNEGENATVTVSLPKDAKNNVTVTINGTDYNATVENGTATITCPVLPAGDTNVTVTYSGDDKYDAKTTTLTIHTKKVSLDAHDMTRGWDSPYDYQARLIDEEGNGIANKTIVFIVNSNQYNATTGSDGIAKLTASKLDVGKYNVTVINPVNGENTTCEITIVARIIENKDLIKDYESSKYYTVRAIGDDGKAVGSGVVVVIEVNGVTYKVKTDKKGHATLGIHLIPRKYVITSTYHKYSVKNNITVKQTLKLVKNTVKVKKGKKIVLKAKLKWSNGKAIKGKVIKFKFKGKTYKAKTSKKGVAKVTIKSKNVLKKLKKGKKYTYTAKYIKNKVKGKVSIK